MKSAEKNSESIVNTNNNVNNNVNNINVHVKHPRKAPAKKEKKPNWIMKAIVDGSIGLALSLIGWYVKHSTEANGKPAFIQNGTEQIIRDKK